MALRVGMDWCTQPLFHERVKAAQLAQNASLTPKQLGKRGVERLGPSLPPSLPLPYPFITNPVLHFPFSPFLLTISQIMSSFYTDEESAVDPQFHRTLAFNFPPTPPLHWAQKPSAPPQDDAVEEVDEAFSVTSTYLDRCNQLQQQVCFQPIHHEIILTVANAGASH